MRKILILSCLLFVIGALVGCVHYSMDSYLSKGTLQASDTADGVRVHIVPFRFDVALGVGRLTVDGELSPWLKEALSREIKNISFIEDRQGANITIEAKDINLAAQSGAGFKPNTRLLVSINGRPVKLIARHPNELAIVDERILSNHLKGISYLLAQVLNDSLSGKRLDLDRLPKEAQGDIKTKGGIYDSLYDLRLTAR